MFNEDLRVASNVSWHNNKEVDFRIIDYIKQKVSLSLNTFKPS